MPVSGGQTILTLSRWAFTVESVVGSPSYIRLRPSSLGNLHRVRNRLARLFSGLESIEAGAAIAAQISSPNIKEVVKGCSDLRQALEGPDFGLALAVASVMKPQLAQELAWQADKFRKIISGKKSSIAPSTKQIAHVADLIARGSVPLSKILRVMHARIPLLNEGAQRSIRSAHIFNRHTLEELFSGRLEDLNLDTYSREGGPKSAALGGLVQAFVGCKMAASGFVGLGQDMPEGLREDANHLFDFLEHPLLQLAFVAYFGIDRLAEALNERGFNGNGFLAPRRSHWDWLIKRPPIEIATERQ